MCEWPFPSSGNTFKEQQPRLLVLAVCFARSSGAPGSRCQVLQEAAAMPLWMAGAGFDLALWPLSLAYPGSCSISSIASSCLCQRRRGGSCRARSCCLAANKLTSVMSWALAGGQVAAIIPQLRG